MAYSSLTQHYIDHYINDGDSRSSDLTQIHENYKAKLANISTQSEMTNAKSDFYQSYFSRYTGNAAFDTDAYDADNLPIDDTASVNSDGIRTDIVGSKEYIFECRKSNLNLIESKLNDLQYGHDDSYHLEARKDENGNVVSPSIDDLISNAYGDEKTMLETKKEQLVAEYDKWSELYGTENTAYNKALLESDIKNGNIELVDILRNEGSEDSINAATNKLAVMEIQYFNDFESKELSGTELADRQAYIDGLKAAYPDYKNQSYDYGSTTYDNAGLITGRASSGVVDKPLVESTVQSAKPSMSLGDLKRSDYESSEKLAWEKNAADRTESDKKAFVSYFDKAQQDPNSDDYKQNRNYYIQYKQELDMPLSYDDKKWAIQNFESKTPNINSAYDAKNYEAEKALIDQYKADVVKDFESKTPNINSAYDAKNYEAEKALMERYKTDLKPVEKTDSKTNVSEVDSADRIDDTVEKADDMVEMKESKVPLSQPFEKPNPYAFDKPARSDGMSDVDYENLCKTAEQEHIAKVNSDMADAVIRGEYGVGQDRIKKLEAEGYDYSQIQSVVNTKMSAYQAQAVASQVQTNKQTTEPIINSPEVSCSLADKISPQKLDDDFRLSEETPSSGSSMSDLKSAETNSRKQTQRQAIDGDESDDLSRKESKSADTKAEDIPKSETNTQSKAATSAVQGEVRVNVTTSSQEQTTVAEPNVDDDKHLLGNNKTQTAGDIIERFDKTGLSAGYTGIGSGKLYDDAPDPFDN